MYAQTSQREVLRSEVTMAQTLAQKRRQLNPAELSTSQTAKHHNAEDLEKLKAELTRIKRKVGLGYDVKVAWHPSETKIVKGGESRSLLRAT